MTDTYKPEGMMGATPENKEALASPEALERAGRAGRILEAPVLLCDSRMRLHVDLGCMRGYIARDEAVWCRREEQLKDIAILTRVGKRVCFHVQRLEMHNGVPFAILSRKSAQKECYFNKISTLLPGDIIKARVTHLEPFGAFLDIGCGIVSLLPIDAISVSRISHPSARLATGDVIDVVVSTKNDGRIYVSRKELLGTWEENAALFSAGQTVPGIVRSIESYGIFIELTPNLTGLAELRENVFVDDCTTVYIKSILPDRMKIKLIILDCGKYSCLPPKNASAAFYPKGNHIDYWRYSPINAVKNIETRFS